MNEKLFSVYSLSYIPPNIVNTPCNSRYDRVYAPASTLYSQKMISWLLDYHLL